jgi:signal transduction histidine kinase
VFRHLKPWQLAVDLSFAALCALARVALEFHPTATVFVLVGMAGALAIRRLSPGFALGLAWLTVILQLSFQFSPDLANLAVLPVLYVTSRYGSRVVRIAGLVSVIVGAIVATLYVLLIGYGQPATTLFTTTEFSHAVVLFVIGLFSAIAVFGISWTLGLLAKTWATAQASRAAQQRAEFEQAVAEREVGIEQERTRIARDMHDVVAHSLAVVIAQADGARYARTTDPDAVDGALTTIASTAREALADVRILLGQLRHSQGEAPTPVLDDLDRLIDQVRASGLIVDRDDSGDALTLGSGAQLAVYRIVQEALTNALRHGDHTVPVTVRFAWTPDALDLEISSGMTEAPLPETASTETLQNPGGHGIDGMRERAILAGGALVAGPRGDRFVVGATVPAVRSTEDATA